MSHDYDLGWHDAKNGIEPKEMVSMYTFSSHTGILNEYGNGYRNYIRGIPEYLETSYTQPVAVDYMTQFIAGWTDTNEECSLLEGYEHGMRARDRLLIPRDVIIRYKGVTLDI